MISQNPIIKRPLSSRRNVPQPKPMAAAFFQRELMQKASERANFLPTDTSQKFIDDVEDYIQQSLMNTRNQQEIFRVYQNAFQILTDKFRQQSPAMVVIKEGYDKLIEELCELSQIGNKHRLVVQKSLTSLNNALQVKQNEYDKKRKGFEDLIGSVQSTSEDLKKEIVNLKEKLENDIIEHKKASKEANKNQAILNKLIKKVEDKYALKDKYLEYIKQNLVNKENLIIDANSAEETLSSVLDSISNSNRSIANTHEAIEELNELNVEADQKIKQRNDIIMEKAKEKEIIGKEICDINKEAQDVRNDITTLCRNLGIALSSSGVPERQISIIGEDPVKLVALAISKKKGFKNGINPELFPDLV